MAANGLQIPLEKIGAIQADYEAGIAPKGVIAIKHKINRKTLARKAQEYNWIYGRCRSDVANDVKVRAAEKIVADETNKLIDYTTKHLKHTRALRTLTAATTSEFAKYVKADKNYSKLKKQEADKLLVIQRTLEVSARTHDLIYKSERLAMGLDKGDVTNSDIDSKVQQRMDRLKNA